MTVGAVDDAVTAGNRDANAAAMSTFSGWGPTDDGRIKPDIVSNGVGLTSSIAAGNSSYDIYSGTSMASPSAAGAAALLVEHYENLFVGEAMRASTLKALILHTASDLGNAGPDYKYGWGLIDVNKAAELISQDANDTDGESIIEGVLTTGASRYYNFESDGNSPVRVTLCWTDPAGTPVVNTYTVGDGALDNNTPMLVNDLDLVIIDNSDPSITYQPYILDPQNPNQPATTGDNVVDNVEQVYIASPNEGAYTVKVSSKSTLSGSIQHFSLILSDPYEPVTPVEPDVINCADGTGLYLDGNDYVDIPSLAAHEFDTFTITVWLNQDTDLSTTTTGQALMGAEELCGETDYLFETDVRPAAGVWTHTAVTRDTSGVVSIYVDGQLTAQDANFPAPTIGCFQSLVASTIEDDPCDANVTTEFFEGMIDEVAIYDRALSAEEIGTVYCAGVIVDPNTVAYWDFEEGTGQTAVDRTGNGHDAQLGSAPGADSNDPNWIDVCIPKCSAGDALEFDGIDDYVEVSDSASLDVTPEITIEAWFNFNEDPYSITQSRAYILDKDFAYRLWYSTTGVGNSQLNQFFFDCFNWDGVNTTGITWEKDKWYHIVCTYEGSVAKVYINGELNTTARHDYISRGIHD